MIYIYSVIFWITGILVFLTGAFLTAIFYNLDRWLDRKGDFIHIISRYFGRVMLWVTRIDVEITGLENINKDKTMLIIANHQSLFDIFLMDGYLPLNFRYVVKKELYSLPILGFCLKAENQIPVDRQHKKEGVKSIKEASEMIAKGRSILIFAEGTRSRDGKVREFKRGSFLVATNTKVDILPVTINGTFLIMRPKKFLIHPGRVKVVIHPPIKTRNLSRAEAKGLAERVQRIVIDGLK